LEIRTNKDHVHFFAQSIPAYSSTKIVRTIKRLTAKEVFRRFFMVNKDLWAVNCEQTANIPVLLDKWEPNQ